MLTATGCYVLMTRERTLVDLSVGLSDQGTAVMTVAVVADSVVGFGVVGIGQDGHLAVALELVAAVEAALAVLAAFVAFAAVALSSSYP